MYNMGFLDFFRKKRNEETMTRIIQNESQSYNSNDSVVKQNINDIAYSEMAPSKAACEGILTTPIPNKSREYAKPKRMKFTNLTMTFFKKNV